MMNLISVKKVKTSGMKSGMTIILLLFLLVISTGGCEMFDRKGTDVTSIITEDTSNTTGDTESIRYDYWVIMSMIVLLYFSFQHFKTKGKAHIVRIGCVENYGYGSFTIFSVKTNKSMSFGHKLWIAVGRKGILDPLASSVDIRFVYVNRDGNSELAGGCVDLKEGSIIGTGETYFPSQPHTNPFICKAWIVTAYYANGEVWKNTDAEKEEEKAKRFIAKKLKRLLS